MSNIIDLQSKKEERLSHAVLDARCEACGHKWVAVFPVTARELECPSCGVFSAIAAQQEQP